ncbi:MAG: sulfatase-like hydrolase/transferase [Actinomycetota bacterium]|nr:sulfatase-like hydrolase/transferase [Actinomycetota bacterium]
MKTLLICLDTVGSDRLWSFGPQRVATPNLDRIASEGAHFGHAFATDIPTQPSHTALFTGRCGASTGIVSHFHPPAMLDERIPWLPKILEDSGCHTGAVDHLFSMKAWFIRGYKDYMAPPGRSRAPASVINDLAFPWLADHAEEDFFLFLHYWDAHIPYVPPEPFRSSYAKHSSSWVDDAVVEKLMTRPSYPLFKENNYDYLDRLPNLDYVEDLQRAEVAYLDWELGRLFGHLEQLGVLDDTLVVVFGDHGEVMTEHDAWFDHAGLYDAVTRVPLVIRAPGRVPTCRLDHLVSLTDVMPTVLEVQGLPPVAGLDGRSLLPLMRGEAVEHRSEIVLSECTWQAKRGIRTPEWKFIRCYDPGIYPRDCDELYDVRSDPDEQHNVAAERSDVVARMDALLDRWLAEQLGVRTDPLVEVVASGLPAVTRLTDVINERGAQGWEAPLPSAVTDPVPGAGDLYAQRRPSDVGTGGSLITPG